MRKLFGAVIMLAIIFSFSACMKKEEDIIDYKIYSTKTRFRAGYDEALDISHIYIFKSKYDLDSYYLAQIDNFVFEKEDDICFKQLIEDFKPAFFNKHYIIMIISEETATPVAYEIEEHNLENNILKLKIKKNKPRYGSYEIVCYHLIIIVPEDIHYSDIDIEYSN
jgi:hypothetical protein